MGTSVDKEEFEDADYVRFARKLRENLRALSLLLERDSFGVGPPSLGAELEVSLVGPSGRPIPINERVLAATADDRFTVELDQFNLECNTRPAPLVGAPLSFLEAELAQALEHLRQVARRYGARVAVVGILPTLVPRDLESSVMSNLPRYRALSAGIRRLRKKPFRVCINGSEPLDIQCEDVTYEGANTSVQIHLRVPPSEFADVYNAVQIATGPALAVSGNSPTFLEHGLWEETRVALFKQSVDDRAVSAGPDRGVPRVCFGVRWLERSAYELFHESVALHEPILPIIDAEDSVGRAEAGDVPALRELRLHHGTVWRWNRAVYDPAEGGHLRIEMRALPSGPTVTDMLANTAFILGLSLAIAKDSRAWTRALPFDAAHANFYRAAQHGLDADLYWRDGSGAAPIAARELLPRLVPLARAGLEHAGIDPSDYEPRLEVIASRIESGQTGAKWQRLRLAQLEASLSRTEALAKMFEDYLEHSEAGAPVHRWPLK